MSPPEKSCGNCGRLRDCQKVDPELDEYSTCVCEGGWVRGKSQSKQ